MRPTWIHLPWAGRFIQKRKRTWKLRNHMQSQQFHLCSLVLARRMPLAALQVQLSALAALALTTRTTHAMLGTKLVASVHAGSWDLAQHQKDVPVSVAATAPLLQPLWLGRLRPLPRPPTQGLQRRHQVKAGCAQGQQAPGAEGGQTGRTFLLASIVKTFGRTM